MAEQIKTLELQFPMIRFFITSHRQSKRKFLRTSYDCHGFYWLFDWECQVRQNFPPITKLLGVIQPTEFKIRKYAYPPALEPGVTAKTKTKIKSWETWQFKKRNEKQFGQVNYLKMQRTKIGLRPIWRYLKADSSEWRRPAGTKTRLRSLLDSVNLASRIQTARSARINQLSSWAWITLD